MYFIFTSSIHTLYSNFCYYGYFGVQRHCRQQCGPRFLPEFLLILKLQDKHLWTTIKNLLNSFNHKCFHAPKIYNKLLKNIIITWYYSLIFYSIMNKFILNIKDNAFKFNIFTFYIAYEQPHKFNCSMSVII